MKINQYYEAGTKFDYTATAPIEYHEIVVAGALVGVSTKSAEIGETIACDAVGVYALKKKTGEAIEQGVKVYVTNGEITATADGGVLAGITWAKAVEADATVLVKLNA